MRRSRRHFVVAAGLVVLVSILTYPLMTLLFPLPIAASAEAGPIDRMINVHFILISFLFSLIAVFIGYSIVVFRRNQGRGYGRWGIFSRSHGARNHLDHCSPHHRDRFGSLGRLCAERDHRRNRRRDACEGDWPAVVVGIFLP